MIEQQRAATRRPALPFPVRITNSLLEFSDRFRSQPAFAIGPDEAISIASKFSGIRDFDCAEFGEPLRKFCGETADPRLSPLGRMARRRDVTGRVFSRLCIEKVLRAQPQLRDEPLQRPWFIMGLHRSGTTVLQRLLAQDPKHRAMLYWEGLLPFPRGPRDTVQRRIEAARSVVAFANYLTPELRTKHEMAAELPEECRLLLGSSLLGRSLWGASKEFDDWFFTADKTRAFELHKTQLQYLQHGSAKRTWILKDPEHLSNLEYLLKAYPDARVIKLHRDPMEVLPSSASLIATYESALLREIDTNHIGRKALAYARRACHSHFNSAAGEQELAQRGVPFIDVRYSDLLADPIRTVAGIYERFDSELSPDAKASMQAYLQCNPKQKHGAHRYTLEEFGLSADAIRKNSHYRERYLDAPAS